jgi:hypothetical protein
MRKYFFAITFLIVFLIASFFAFYLAKTDSLTVDEKAHIPAGYSYVAKGDFRLNPEHPPLLKSLSGFSLLITKKIWGGNGFFEKESWVKADQWQAGTDFIFNSGSNADRLIFIARIPTILFYLGLGILLFFVAKSFSNRWVGLLSMTLFYFCPTMIAHGHLVTTDVPIAFFFLLTVFSFYKYLTVKPEKQKRWLYFSVVSLALAFLTKFSAIVLVVVMFLMLLYFSYLKKKNENIGFWVELKSQLSRIFKYLPLFVLMIYVVYFLVSFKYGNSTYDSVVKTSFATPSEESLRGFLYLFSNSIFLRPIGQFIIGFLMVFFHVGGGHTAFLLGDISKTGWWYFFPVAFFFKTTLPVLIAFLISTVVLFFKKSKNYFPFFITSLGLIIIYFLISMSGSLNLGIRHLIPIYPFIFLIISFGIYEFWKLKNSWLNLFLILLVLWHVFESVLSFPNYLSYFNELRFNKDKKDILVDSSLDWGQDLKRLKTYVDKKEIKNLKIDYFGGADVNYYFKNIKEYRAYMGKTKGWLAVSVTSIQMSKDTSGKLPQQSYEWLNNYIPEKKVGDSIYLYNIK